MENPPDPVNENNGQDREHFRGADGNQPNPPPANARPEVDFQNVFAAQWDQIPQGQIHLPAHLTADHLEAIRETIRLRGERADGDEQLPHEIRLDNLQGNQFAEALLQMLVNEHHLLLRAREEVNAVHHREQAQVQPDGENAAGNRQQVPDVDMRGNPANVNGPRIDAARHPPMYFNIGDGEVPLIDEYGRAYRGPDHNGRRGSVPQFFGGDFDFGGDFGFGVFNDNEFGMYEPNQHRHDHNMFHPHVNVDENRQQPQRPQNQFPGGGHNQGPVPNYPQNFNFGENLGRGENFQPAADRPQEQGAAYQNQDNRNNHDPARGVPQAGSEVNGDQGGGNYGHAAGVPAANVPLVPQPHDPRMMAYQGGAPFVASKDADKIVLRSIPKYGDYEAWRDNALAAIVCASGRPNEAALWIAEVARKSIFNPQQLAVPIADLYRTCAPDMRGLDAKLFSAISHVVAQLPGQDATNLTKLIRDVCKGRNFQPNFCGRQALRLVDCYFEHSSARRSKAHVQELFQMEPKNRDLEEFIGRWDSVCQKLYGTNDLPSFLSLGSLFENKISKAFRNDPMKEMVLMEWRTTTTQTTSPHAINFAYQKMISSFRTMCRVERVNRLEHPSSNAAAGAAATKKKKDVKSPSSSQPKKGAAAKATPQSSKGKGQGKGKSHSSSSNTKPGSNSNTNGSKSSSNNASSRSNDTGYKGTCTYDRTLCGKYGHRREDCFYNPQGKNYKGQKWVKDQIDARVKALTKIGGTEFGFNKGAAATKDPSSSANDMAEMLDEYLLNGGRAAAAKSRCGNQVFH